MFKFILFLWLSLILNADNGSASNGRVLIQKHWIGEPVEQLLQEEPEVLSRLTECHSLINNPDAYVLNNPDFHSVRIKSKNKLSAKDEALKNANNDLYKAILSRRLTQLNCKDMIDAFDKKADGYAHKEDWSHPSELG